MKLSLLTLAASLSASASFVPPSAGGPSRIEQVVLHGAVSGEDVRHARPKLAPGHFETHGTKASAGRYQCNGEDVRHSRPKFAPGIFESHGSRSTAGRTQSSGEDVRHARPKFAPGHFETHGTKSSAGRYQTNGEDVRHARQKFAPGIIETKSGMSSSGGYALPSLSGGVPPASYGLGGGSKKAAGTSTGAATGYLGNL